MCILQVQGAAIYIDIAAPCTCLLTCPKMSCTTGTYLWVEKLEGIYLSNAEIKKGILRHF